MTAFEVYLNGKRICTAGVGEVGVLSTSLAWRGTQQHRGGKPVPSYLRLDIGGIPAISGERSLVGP